MIIREANLNDIYKMNLLFSEVDSLHAENLPKHFRKTAQPARSNDYLISIIDNVDSHIFVAEENNTLIGLITVFLKETPKIPILQQRKYCDIDCIVVNSSVRRQKIGLQLMNIAENWAKNRGADEMTLNVYNFNSEAVSFYNHIGYSTISRKMRKEI